MLIVPGNTLTTRQFPNLATECSDGTPDWGDDNCNKTAVYTVAKLVKPQFSERNVGGLMFKRVVVHFKDGEWKADTFSVGYCRVCPDGVVPFSSTKGAFKNLKDELRSYYKDCYNAGTDCTDELQAEIALRDIEQACVGDAPVSWNRLARERRDQYCKRMRDKVKPALIAFQDAMAAF